VLIIQSDSSCTRTLMTGSSKSDLELHVMQQWKKVHTGTLENMFKVRLLHTEYTLTIATQMQYAHYTPAYTHLCLVRHYSEFNTTWKSRRYCTPIPWPPHLSCCIAAFLEIGAGSIDEEDNEQGIGIFLSYNLTRTCTNWNNNLVRLQHTLWNMQSF
jgi:hypothetical protein